MLHEIIKRKQPLQGKAPFATTSKPPSDSVRYAKNDFLNKIFSKNLNFRKKKNTKKCCLNYLISKNIGNFISIYEKLN